jgi:hypothetical protein
MKKVISASRRTDLVAFFPDWFSTVLKLEEVNVHGPSGYTYAVDLKPASVHTVVLWSKNFTSLIENRSGLKNELLKYEQVYLHFTITGLGGTFIERGVPPYTAALLQLGDLVRFVGNPERISIRFDPVVYWKERGEIQSNLHLFEKIAPYVHKQGVKDIRVSFAQWYRKAKRRAAKHKFIYVDPPQVQKLKDALYLVQIAQRWGLNLYSCSQDFLAAIPDIRPSSCIDGNFLQRLHPGGEPVSLKKDKTQRQECRCTESKDIGSYTQYCPHSCLYCYANPII